MAVEQAIQDSVLPFLGFPSILRKLAGKLAEVRYGLINCCEWKPTSCCRESVKQAFFANAYLSGVCSMSVQGLVEIAFMFVEKKAKTTTICFSEDHSNPNSQFMYRNLSCRLETAVT